MLFRYYRKAETEQDVAAITAELGELEREIASLRGSASGAGVVHSQLDRALSALGHERRLLASMVAAELRDPAPAGAYARYEHARWGIPGEPIE